MKSRGLVVALALLLAIGATAAVFLYVNGVREDASTTGTLTTVIVSTQDVQANADLDPLLAEDGVFAREGRARVHPRGRRRHGHRPAPGPHHHVPIIANEQIPLSRLDTGDSTLANLDISPGHVATTVRVDGPAGVGGNLIAGSNVTVYATFDGVQSLQLGEGAREAGDRNAPPGPPQASLPSLTLTLIPT